MTSKLYFMISGLVFVLVALLHVYRIATSGNLVIGAMSVPMSVSWIALILAAALAFFGLRFASSKD